MRPEAYTGYMRDLNRLQFAAEAIEVPELPELPDWNKSPASFENGETRTREEAEALGLTWIQTYLGLAFDLDAPRREQIEIEDIAHALSNVCRYGGHCAWHYSVAQHSIYVAELVNATQPELALTGLLHDAAEAYLGDWSSPLKQVFKRIAIAVLGLEHDIEKVIGARYGVDIATRNTLVKSADLITLADEKAALFGPSPRPNWAASSGYDPAQPSGRQIERLSPEQAKARFLEAFERYGGKS